MIVPKFWAEARIQHRERRKQVTFRRFGWSDDSQEAAQALAEKRVAEALQLWKDGQTNLPRRDWKRPYNGADGIPIREEIVEHLGDCVVTRNSYGARCLNTPSVFFADIDYEEKSSEVYGCLGSLLLLGGLTMLLFERNLVWLSIFVVLMVGAGLLLWGIRRIDEFLNGTPAEKARRRIEAFIQAHPDWHLRLYETPAGLRLLALHDLLEPQSAIVRETFEQLGVDPLYALMCRNQNCFRARVSPKPWRIGISRHMKPRPGVWPIAEDRMAERRAWIEDYEKQSCAFSACRYVASLGSPTVHPQADSVRQWHDDLCGALSDRPIA